MIKDPAFIVMGVSITTIAGIFGLLINSMYQQGLIWHLIGFFVISYVIAWFIQRHVDGDENGDS